MHMKPYLTRTISYAKCQLAEIRSWTPDDLPVLTHKVIEALRDSNSGG